MNKKEVELRASKLISFWLRHDPKAGNLKVDEFSWADVGSVLKSLEKYGIKIDLDGLKVLHNSADKVRWEIKSFEKNGFEKNSTNIFKIRATHGHSIPVKLVKGEVQETPPKILYHGTNIGVLRDILKTGLKPMNRQFVHLSDTVKMARKVGLRRGDVVLIGVKTEAMLNDDLEIFKTGEGVWLTKNVPPQYLDFLPWNFNYNNLFMLEELKTEIGQRKTHEFYPLLNDLKCLAGAGYADEFLFKNIKTGEIWQIHLTFSGQEENMPSFPGYKYYPTFENWVENMLIPDQNNYLEGVE